MATSSASACLGSRAQAALAEFRDMVGHQREAGAGPGREIARATRAVLAAGDAFEPREKITQEIRRLVHMPVYGRKSRIFWRRANGRLTAAAPAASARAARRDLNRRLDGAPRQLHSLRAAQDRQ